MATVQQGNGATTGNYFQGSSTKNNNGTMMSGGSTSTKLSKISIKRNDVSVFASVVAESSVVGNTKAISGGVFAHDHVKPLTARVTNELAGLVSTALSKTNDPITRSINKIESVTTNRTSTAFRNGNFNLYTGKYSSVTTATDSLGSDVAANPTGSNPGRLVYQLSKPKPVSTSYKAVTTIV